MIESDEQKLVVVVFFETAAGDTTRRRKRVLLRHVLSPVFRYPVLRWTMGSMRTC